MAQTSGIVLYKIQQDYKQCVKLQLQILLYFVKHKYNSNFNRSI